MKEKAKASASLEKSALFQGLRKSSFQEGKDSEVQEEEEEEEEEEENTAKWNYGVSP